MGKKLDEFKKFSVYTQGYNVGLEKSKKMHGGHNVKVSDRAVFEAGRKAALAGESFIKSYRDHITTAKSDDDVEASTADSVPGGDDGGGDEDIDDQVAALSELADVAEYDPADDDTADDDDADFDEGDVDPAEGDDADYEE